MLEPALDEWYALGVIARVPLKATDDDVLRVSAENPAWRIERSANGELVLTPPTGIETSPRNVLLTRLIDDWARAHGCVAFDSNGGFRLPDTSIVGPDGAIVSQDAWDRLTPKQRQGFFPGAPLVAIELCSRTDEPAQLRAKLERIRQAGASYVVLIDPYRGQIWTDGVAPEAFDIDFEQLLK